MAAGRLRRPTFGFGRLKKNTGRLAGHPALLSAFSTAVTQVTDCNIPFLVD